MPSGNFGNVCAGHVARMMGLPIDQLVVATNENDVLDEFFRTGVYRVRSSADTHETSSPSMDISQGLELRALRVRPARPRRGAHARAVRRGRDATAPSRSTPPSARASAASASSAGSSTHADRLATIRDMHERFGVMIDTHTADGLKVAREHSSPACR